MNEWRFRTPGDVDSELPSDFHDKWHAWHCHEADTNVADMRKLLRDNEAYIPYANPAVEQIPHERVVVSVPWEGFPARMILEHGKGKDSLEKAETKGYDDLGGGGTCLVDKSGNVYDGKVRHHQDEYLEWESERDSSGKLVAVTFVSEGYDYWSELFECAPEHVVEEFSKASGVETITKEDLCAQADLFLSDDKGKPTGEPVIAAGTYNWRHQFNQAPGIRHLSHKANSLGAEINLAVTSSLLRHDKDKRPVAPDPKRLLCCTGGGDPNRSSDPTIAAGAYSYVTNVKKPKRFTLTNPVGLYVRSFDLQAMQLPNGDQAPPDICSVERGVGDPTQSETSENRILRMRISAPKGAKFSLGDMKIDKGDIERGAQLAKLVGMHLLVDIWDADRPSPGLACGGGCCRRKDEQILYTYDKGQTCGEGLVDVYPELVSSAKRGRARAKRAAKTRI